MKTSVLAVFAGHPVAANLLMVMMMISGLWGLSQLNTQFFPSFDIDFVSVRVTWPGASAEDLETLVTDPLERELKGIDNVKELASLSVDGQSLITLEFRENTDMGPALDEVKERVDLVTNLPDGADKPKISRIINHELVASLLVSGPDDRVDCAHWSTSLNGNCSSKASPISGFSGSPKKKLRSRSLRAPCVNSVSRLKTSAAKFPQLHGTCQLVSSGGGSPPCSFASRTNAGTNMPLLTCP